MFLIKFDVTGLGWAVFMHCLYLPVHPLMMACVRRSTPAVPVTHCYLLPFTHAAPPPPYHHHRRPLCNRPEEGWFGFEGFDWDIEGNDDGAHHGNLFQVEVLDLMGVRANFKHTLLLHRNSVNSRTLMWCYDPSRMVCGTLIKAISKLHSTVHCLPADVTIPVTSSRTYS